MAKLVVNIKGQSEEFGLTDDARDIGGNDYLTISNSNKKQYARLGNNATKLIIRKNNQKFYVQKDPIYFETKKIEATTIGSPISFDVYLPKGNYNAKNYYDNYFSVSVGGMYKVVLQILETSRDTYFSKLIINNNGKKIIERDTSDWGKSQINQINRVEIIMIK